MPTVDRAAIAGAWAGRISGCQLGKAVRIPPMMRGPAGLHDYLVSVDALPVRDYIPFTDGRSMHRGSCRGHIERSDADDDVNYSVLALVLLERHGRELETVDVA